MKIFRIHGIGRKGRFAVDCTEDELEWTIFVLKAAGCKDLEYVEVA